MKRMVSLIAAVLLIAMAFGGCGSKNNDDGSSSSSSLNSSEAVEQNKAIDESKITLKQFEDPEPGSEIATVKTNMGSFKLMFFPEEAPKAVENFITHAKEGYYNGLKFFRVIEDFMLQSGDPDNNGTGGTSIYEDKYFEDEFSLNLWHFTGAVSMANTGAADTNSSQFFIVQGQQLTDEYLDSMLQAGFPPKVVEKYRELGGQPPLDQRHTVFAQVIEGMDVINAIAAVEKTENDRGEVAVPVEDVIIESITFEEA